MFAERVRVLAALLDIDLATWEGARLERREDGKIIIGGRESAQEEFARINPAEDKGSTMVNYRHQNGPHDHVQSSHIVQHLRCL